MRFVEALELFGIGASWGGYESLAVPTTGFITRTAGPAISPARSCGCISGWRMPDDLIADLEHGLARLGG